jgi:hypothetical protein
MMTLDELAKLQEDTFTDDPGVYYKAKDALETTIYSSNGVSFAALAAERRELLKENLELKETIKKLRIDLSYYMDRKGF